MRGVVDWVKVRELAADGVSEREIAGRLGMNRRTVARLARSESAPRYERAPSGSMLDPLEPVMRDVLAEWPAIKAPRMTEILREHGYAGSVDLVKRRLAELRPPRERPAQRTDYSPGQTAQVDWCEMPTRPRIDGRERRIYALVVAMPHSGAQTARFSYDMTVESFLEGHVHAFSWLGGVPRELVYDNLRAAVARRRANEITWAERFLHLRGHYGFHAHACTPGTPREKGSVENAVRYLKSGFWPARRICSLTDLDDQYAAWRDDIANVRVHATRTERVDDRLARERTALRALPPGGFDSAGERITRVPIDGYLKLCGAFYRAPAELTHQRVALRFSRDEVWITHKGAEVARYARSWEPGVWIPAPLARPEPPPVPQPAVIQVDVTPPELSDYAALVA